MKVQNVDPAKLVPAEYNPRNISAHQAEALKRSIDRWGFVEPIVANKRTGKIVGGHQRVDAALALAVQKVPVHWVDLDEDSEKALNIALNKISGEWDNDTLAALLADLEQNGQDLEDLGFDADELQELIDMAAPKPDLMGDLDEIPEPPAEPITQPGDVWQLGDHRLMCGDSTKAEDVAKLMNGAKASLMVTDPPYGVNYEGGAANKNKREKLAGDGDADLYAAMLEQWNVTPAYIWFADSKGRAVYDAVEDAGLTVRALIVWHKLKAHYGAFMAQYMQKHEPCLYCVKGGEEWHGPTNEVTVWEIDQPSRNEFHPTQKPIECMARAIRNSAKRNQIVVDPFSGSGTTIIAAEQEGCRCYAMEISPAYCDVAVKRWEQATGQKAERV